MAVTEVNSEPYDLLNDRGSYLQVTTSSVYHISTHLHQNKVSFSNISKEIGIPEFERNIDFTIGGFLAGPPGSPLIMCSSFQVS